MGMVRHKMTIKPTEITYASPKGESPDTPSAVLVPPKFGYICSATLLLNIATSVVSMVWLDRMMALMFDAWNATTNTIMMRRCSQRGQ